MCNTIRRVPVRYTIKTFRSKNVDEIYNRVFGDIPYLYRTPVKSLNDLRKKNVLNSIKSTGLKRISSLGRL